MMKTVSPSWPNVIADFAHCFKKKFSQASLPCKEYLAQRNMACLIGRDQPSSTKVSAWYVGLRNYSLKADYPGLGLKLFLFNCDVTRITEVQTDSSWGQIINVFSDERCELWQEPSVSRNLVPQCLIFYQISQLVAIRDWYLPKFWCQPNGRRMSKFEIAICIPPDPASANFCPFQVLTAELYKKRYRMIIKRASQV